MASGNHQRHETHRHPRERPLTAVRVVRRCAAELRRPVPAVPIREPRRIPEAGRAQRHEATAERRGTRPVAHAHRRRRRTLDTEAQHLGTLAERPVSHRVRPEAGHREQQVRPRTRWQTARADASDQVPLTHLLPRHELRRRREVPVVHLDWPIPRDVSAHRDVVARRHVRPRRCVVAARHVHHDAVRSRHDRAAGIRHEIPAVLLEPRGPGGQGSDPRAGERAGMPPDLRSLRVCWRDQAEHDAATRRAASTPSSSSQALVARIAAVRTYSESETLASSAARLTCRS